MNLTLFRTPFRTYFATSPISDSILNMKTNVLEVAKPMAFIVSRDRAKAKAFYAGVLGFALTGEDDFAAVFDMNGTMLRISTVREHTPPPHTVLGWEVQDIAATVHALGAAGVKFTVYDGFGQDPLGIWTAPGSGDQVAWFLDPDGNNLSLTQFARG
jgi:catechol 2,3-dioxygenase-like lactoylglutathione lyase family enzyme